GRTLPSEQDLWKLRCLHPTSGVEDLATVSDSGTTGHYRVVLICWVLATLLQPPGL
ncbi:hypothetical protein M9458_053920, partial [Cirrhinus mrigala]